MSWWVWLIIGAVILNAVVKGKEEGERKKQEELKKKAYDDAMKRKKEAEDYILSSGDPDAIKMLMLARANPGNYTQVLSGGMNRGNDTLKTALGVMAGVAAGNLIATAITASAISSALEEVQAELNSLDVGSIGGDSLASSSIFDDIDFS